ncbi:hypothetical protein SB719_22245, partial [Pantoea sp. SIMBA_079]|uniref:hypothetical protein n=1 Tax=Pantoea sp. SIMBA_079 TaxID=3085817 RepID=UPI0039949144
GMLDLAVQTYHPASQRNWLIRVTETHQAVAFAPNSLVRIVLQYTAKIWIIYNRILTELSP